MGSYERRKGADMNDKAPTSIYGTDQKDEIRRRLENLPVPNLHSEILECEKDLRQASQNKALQAHSNRLQSMLESMQTEQTHLFQKVPFFGNLLVTVYLYNQDHSQAFDLNNEMLESFPGDLTAELNDIHILLENDYIESAEEKLSSVEKRERSSSQFYSAMVDVAFLYYSLPPKFYSKAVQLFETAVEGIRGELHDQTLVWKYYLFSLYNRLLNSGNIKVQLKEMDLSPDDCFQKIIKIAVEIVSDRETDKVLFARVLTDLYDAHNKKRFKPQKGRCHCTLCDQEIQQILKQTKLMFPKVDLNDLDCKRDHLDQLLKVAQQLAPEDGHTLEKIGRIQRIQSTRVSQLKKAEETLKACVKLYAKRHVGWHQLGLTYKSMWLCDHPTHKLLFSNQYKTGAREKGKKKKEKEKGNDWFSCLADEIAKESWKVENQLKEKSEAPQELVKSSSADVEQTQTENVKIQVAHNEPVESRDPFTCCSRNPPHSVTIQPAFQTPFGKQPKQRRRADFFDTLRTENPQYDGDEVPDTLSNALKCFKEANEIVNGTQCKILIDLGRCCISMKKVKEAERYFSQAKRCIGATDHELAYLYEQLAMLVHSECLAESTVLSRPSLSQAKSLYRKSVECAVKSKQRSKVAFYKLKDLLLSEISHRDDYCIRAEYALLEKLVENYQKASATIHEAILMSEETWRKNPQLREMAWELVDIFAKNGQYTDAWLYLKMNLLLVAEIKHQSIILEVGLQTARSMLNVRTEDSTADKDADEKDDHLIWLFTDYNDYIKATNMYGQLGDGSSQQVLKQIFQSLIKLHYCPARSVSMVNVQTQHIRESMLYRSPSTGNCNVDNYDVLLVVSNDDYTPPGYWEIKLLLQHSGLTVKDDEDVLLPGAHVSSPKYEQLAEKATAVLIFSDKLDVYDNLRNTAWALVEMSSPLQPIACLHSNPMQVTKLNWRVPTICTCEFVRALPSDDQPIDQTIADHMIKLVFKTLCIDYFEKK